MKDCQKHPSYANLYIGRSQCSGQRALFGSSIKHRDVICMRISPAYISRSFNEDRYYADAYPYIEIEMSQAQFAQAITSLNMADGTPVTLTALNGQTIEECPYEDKRRAFADELKIEMKQISEEFEKGSKEAEEILETKKTLSKSDREKILSSLQYLSKVLTDHIPFMYSQFNKQMDKTVAESKAEIESHIQSRISDLAMKAMGEQFAVNQAEDGELPQHEQNENEHEDEEEDENIDEGMTMG